jgi:hypothetical protein
VISSDAGIGLTEIRLQLLARRRLKPHRCPGSGPQLLTPGFHRPLHRAQRHGDGFLAGKLLAHHIGIAVRGQEPLLEPVALSQRGPVFVSHLDQFSLSPDILNEDYGHFCHDT